MVTRKSNISTHEDSYGLVIPVDRLRKFLTAKLPADSRNLPPPSAAAVTLKADVLYKKVAPSVVFVENLREMQAFDHEQEQGK